MDWDAWARKAERALDVAGRGDWKGLFAPEATFADPHTSSTRDLGRISRQTRTIFPDWRQEITRIRGGEGWAVFEWIGRGNFTSRGTPGGGMPVQSGRATVVEVDETGQVEAGQHGRAQEMSEEHQ